MVTVAAMTAAAAAASAAAVVSEPALSLQSFIRLEMNCSCDDYTKFPWKGGVGVDREQGIVMTLSLHQYVCR